MVDRYNHI